MKTTRFPPEKLRESETHHLIAGVLCLDFANTVNGHTRPDPHEYLLEYQDVALWSLHAGILDASQAAQLLQAAAQDEIQTREAYQSAIRLRESIFRLFSRTTTGPADLQTLNEFRQEALSHSHLEYGRDGYHLGWDDESSLERPLWVVALSAADLLVSEKIRAVRKCAGCDWLFLDASRNHQRRWCSMAECGNRSKMRRRSRRQLDDRR